jgi:O-antigen ligase
MYKFISSNRKDLLYSIPGFCFFLYLLFPFRFWQPFVFSNQTETIVVTTFFASLFFLLFILKTVKFHKPFQFSVFQFTKIDISLIIYGIYLLSRLRCPVEKEILFQSFSIICIYLYFRNFPDKYIKILIPLIPLSAIAQILDGLNRFAMPWQTLSHITGIFNNTGLFGGFTALSLVVCLGFLFFFHSGKEKFNSLILIIIISSIFLFAIQVYNSGSRASWLAVFGVIIFLLHKIIPIWKKRLTFINPGKFHNPLVTRFLSILIILIILLLFSKNLYTIKKDSADGRLLIAMVSIEMIEEAPVFGSGISGFMADYLSRQANYFRSQPDSAFKTFADDVETPFNEYLKILIEQGIIGLLLFAALIYLIFEKELPINTQHYIILTIQRSILLFILIFALFSYPFDKLPFLVLFIFSIASLSQNRRPVYNINLKEKTQLKIPLLILFFFSFLISMKIAINAHIYSGSCKTWNRALTDFPNNREQSLNILKNLHKILDNNPIFLTTYGKALSLGEHYEEAAAVLEKAVNGRPFSTSYIELGKCYEALEIPEKAFSCWERANFTVPSRFTPLYLTMKLHFKNKNCDSAQKCAEQLLNKKIKIENSEIDYMKKEAFAILGFHPP